jgi:uncharacterized protein YqeY
MSLYLQLRDDMKSAMKAKDAMRLSVLRGLLTLCTQELTSTNRTPQDTLSDEEVLALIRRSVKQRADAAQQYRAGGRDDLAGAEEAEAEILQAYLPAQLSREQVRDIAERCKKDLGITEKKDFGRLMGVVMKETAGNADGGMVKQVVEELLK